MDNKKEFQRLVDEFLGDKGSKYKNEIANFQNFLKDRLLEEKIFNLNVNHIDDYFKYSFNYKIGAVTTLTTHISALKSLFDFLIFKERDFKSLYAYIDTAGFKEKLSAKLEKSSKKPIMESSLLNSTLYKFDSYIKKNINLVFKKGTSKKKFLEILIARLYAKLSLIIPLKPNLMLEIKLNNFKSEENRVISYNGIIINLPNSLRSQIIETIDFVELNFNIKFTDDTKLFYYLYGAIGKKATTSLISQSFIKTYKQLNITEMLKKITIGKKDMYLYPPECYKITSISSLLRNGTNIIYLCKLTGLDINTLLSDFEFDDFNDLQNSIISININNGLINTDYFTYL